MTVNIGHPEEGLPHFEQSKELFWESYRLSQAFLKVQNHWAKELGVTASQFLILRAVEENSESRGISVKAVAAKLELHPSSITAQSKILESLGLIKRTASEADARFVLMGLTSKATTALHNLDHDRQAMETMISAALSSEELGRLIERIRLIRKRTAKGLRLLTIDEGDL